MPDTTTRLREMWRRAMEYGTHGIVDLEAITDAIGEIERLKGLLDFAHHRCESSDVQWCAIASFLGKDATQAEPNEDGSRTMSGLVIHAIEPALQVRGMTSHGGDRRQAGPMLHRWGGSLQVIQHPAIHPDGEGGAGPSGDVHREPGMHPGALQIGPASLNSAHQAAWARRRNSDYG